MPAAKLALAEGGLTAESVMLGAVAFGGTAGAMALLAAADGTWDAWTPATCLSSELGCFCERPRHTLVRQPANTFSNLAFTATGVLVLLEAGQQRLRAAGRAMAPAERLGIAFALVFGAANALLGAGSGWYHASLTFHGQWLDNAGMYLVVSASALFSLASVRLASNAAGGGLVGRFLAEYVAVNALLGWLCLRFPVLRRDIFTGLLVIAVLAELAARHKVPGRAARADGRVLLAAVGAFLAGFVLWVLDLKHLLCSPDSLWQGHAAWHALCGVASFLLFVYLHPIAFRPPAKAEEAAANTEPCVIV